MVTAFWKGKRPRSTSHEKGKMNKTEESYANHLLSLKYAGEILDFRFEALKLRLADNCFYTPDFFVIFADRFELHEVKGWWEDDARVKIKVAAHQYPWFRFLGIKLVKKQWEYEEFSKGGD